MGSEYHPPCVQNAMHQHMAAAHACVCSYAQVQAVPEHYLQEKPMLASEFADDTTWPKHLLVYYRWEARQQLNQHLGLYVLLLAGV